MTVFMMQPGLPAGEMKRTVSIVAHENGYDIPALTLIAGNPDFPVSDLNQLGTMMTGALMGQPLPAHDDLGDTHIHYARAENGQMLDHGYKLRYRTKNSGVTAEDGIFVAINETLPPYIKTQVHERFAQVIQNTLNAYHGIAPHPSADAAPAPQV